MITPPIQRQPTLPDDEPILRGVQALRDAMQPLLLLTAPLVHLEHLLSVEQRVLERLPLLKGELRAVQARLDELEAQAQRLETRARVAKLRQVLPFWQRLTYRRTLPPEA